MFKFEDYPQGKLRFKPSLQVEVIEPDILLLLSEKKISCIQGRLTCKLASFLLKENLTSEEIVQTFNEFPPEEVYYALFLLDKGEYLEIKRENISDELLAYCDLLEVSQEDALKELKNGRVYLKALNGNHLEELKLLLTKQHIELVSEKEKADLWVVVADDYLNEELEQINREALENLLPWMLIKPLGKEIWQGPLLDPKQLTPCWECLKIRMEKNRIEEAYVRRAKKGNSSTLFKGWLPSTEQIGISLAALEIFKWMIFKKQKSSLLSKILSFDSETLELKEHLLFKNPDCRACGKPEKKTILWDEAPFLLVSRKKISNCDGGYHTTAPEEILERFKDQISPLTGVVKYIDPPKDFSEKNSPVHVFLAGHNFALSNSHSNIFKAHLRSSSAGKGKTEVQAKASCLCEAIERYSGIFQGNEKRIKGTYQQLQKDAIHPDQLLLFSTSQYQKREKNPTSDPGFNFIPCPFSEDKEIEWTPVWSLTQKKYRMIPTAFCYYGYSSELENLFCVADSNGNAAGNTLEEAILQGFFELVERDSVAIWWYNRLRKEAVDLSSFDDPYFLILEEEYKKKGRKMWVLDLTTDLNIPSFVACSANEENGKKIVIGFGCHQDPSIGICRALTEMNQMLSLTHLVLKNESNPVRPLDKEISQWMKEASVDNQPYLQPKIGTNLKKKKDYKPFQSEDLLEHIHLCKEIVEQKGMEMLVLDQTREDIGLPTAKVIVPGLRHFWARFAPGRLYDVPVQLGWLKAPLQEDELNPINMFL